MISGFTILSNPEKYKYPWREAIKSFLPLVDELVVVYDVYSSEDYRDSLKKMGCRVVSGIFDLRKFGWLSYGIMRTTGYLACKGDMVLMFDADGILHEKDVQKTKEQVTELLTKDNYVYGFWGKNRIYSPTKYWLQNKHSGWYKKKILGDNFDFYNQNKKGIPNWDMIPSNLRDGLQLDVRLFGYEHVFDTREILFERIVNYGRMHDLLGGVKPKSDDEYIKVYIDDLKESFNKKGKVMSIDEHPAIIKDKLLSLTDKQFGFSFFNLI